MDYMVSYVSKKETIANIQPICCGCLSKDVTTASLSCGSNRRLYEELTNINLEDDVLYALCWQCSALLYKCVQFRQKLLRCHATLQQCYNSVDAKETAPMGEDLDKHTYTQLSYSNIFTLSHTETKDLGDNHVIHNNKSRYEYIISTKEELVLESKHDCDEELAILKTEPEEHVMTSVEEETAEESQFLKELEKDVINCEINEEKTEVRRAEVVETASVVSRKPQRSKTVVPTETTKKNSTRCTKRLIVLDPAKIRTIDLTETQQRQHLQMRRNELNFLKFPFKCEFCPTGFNFRKKLKDHMDLHDKNRGSYRCDICLIYLCNNSTYNCHKKKHSTMYECVACGKTSNTKHLMVEHYSMEHESSYAPYTCPICGKVYANTKKHTVYLHMRQHKLEQTVQCDVCQKIFNTKDKLRSHMFIHMDKQNAKTFICPSCGHRTRTAKELEYHSVKHVDHKPHYCVECDRGFKTYATLRQHLETHSAHRNPEKLKYACAQCPRRFSWRRELAAHTDRDHDGVKRHACDECGKTFYGKQSLTAHIRYTHEGRCKVKKHRCDICRKMFYSSYLLRQHLYVHTGERPYTCTECPATFTQSGARSVHHRLVHLKLKRSSNREDKIIKDKNEKVIE